MEGIEHPHGVRQGGAQRRGVAAVGVQRRGRDRGPPAGLALAHPADQRRCAAVGDHIEQPGGPAAAGQIDDAGHEAGRAGRRRGLERGLVHPDRLDPVEAGGVVHPRRAVGADRGHRGAPADPELAGHRGHRRAVLTDPAAHLGPGPLGQRRPRRDLRRGLGPGPGRAQLVRAPPHPLDPHQRHRPTRRGQVPDPARPPIMQLRDRPALGATDQIRGRLHRLLELAVVLGHRQHDEPRQAQHRRRSTTLSFHLGPPISVS